LATAFQIVGTVSVQETRDEARVLLDFILIDGEAPGPADAMAKRGMAWWWQAKQARCAMWPALPFCISGRAFATASRISLADGAGSVAATGLTRPIKRTAIGMNRLVIAGPRKGSTTPRPVYLAVDLDIVVVGSPLPGAGGMRRAGFEEFPLKKLRVKGLIGGPEGMYSSSAGPTILAYAFISGSWETLSAKKEEIFWTKHRRHGRDLP